MSAATAPAPGSPEALEAALAAQRAALVADLEDLGARLAPEALKTQARQCASQAVSQARAGFTSAFEQARAKAAGARAGGGRSLAARFTRLLDDARDGDPGSLAVVTGVAVALAGLSVVAVVKAVRS